MESMFIWHAFNGGRREARHRLRDRKWSLLESLVLKAYSGSSMLNFNNNSTNSTKHLNKIC